MNILSIHKNKGNFYKEDNKNNQSIDKIKEKVKNVKVFNFLTDEIVLINDKLYGKGEELPKIDFVIFGGYGFPVNNTDIIKYIEDKGGISIVSSENIKYFSKEEQYKSVKNTDLEKYYPKTYLYFFSGNKEQPIENIILNIEEQNKIAFGNKYPFVIKKSLGGNGTDVVLIKNNKEIYDYLEKVSNDNFLGKFLIQEPVNCEPGLDNRVYIIGGKLHSVTERRNPGSFVSNVAKGGETVFIPLEDIDDKMLELIDKISKHFSGLIYAGLDIVKTLDGEYKFFEINVVGGYKNIFYNNKYITDDIANNIVDEILKRNDKK